jgi:hypothetical protein
MSRVLNWLIACATLGLVSYIAQKNPKLGAFVLTLPIVSILAIVLNWQQTHDISNVSRFARETLILVPLGLPFFVPLAFADRLGLGFWQAFGLGLVITLMTVGSWLWFGKS